FTIYRLLINLYYTESIQRTLNKILTVEQENTALVRELGKNLLRLETNFEKKLEDISDIVLSLKEQESTSVLSDKQKGKGDAFYKVNFIFILLIPLNYI